MAPHALVGVIHKLRNADDHMHRLHAETLAYLNSGPNASILSERDTDDSGCGRFRFKVLRQPPLKLAAIAGDVVHNLRSALDYVVDELVRANGHTPTFQNLYPICVDAKAFDDALRKGRLYGVNPRAVRAVEGFQPYQVKPEARARHPLTHLHKLSNRDKHHMLAISALNASFNWSFVDVDGRVLRTDKTVEPVADGGVLASFPTEFMIDGSKVQMQSQISITIAFSEPAFPGYDVLGCLQSVREFIGEFMVPAFEVLFGPLPDDLKLTSHGIVTRAKPVEMLVLARESEKPSQ